MFTNEERAFLAQATQTMQIIVGALAAGVVLFFLVTLVVAANGERQVPETPLISYMAIAATPMAILMALIVPGVVMRSHREAIVAGNATSQEEAASVPPLPAEEEKLLPLMGGYQTALILRTAILEGAAFLCLTAYMLEGQAWVLIGAGLLLLFMLAAMPTRSRVEDAIERERQAANELRQMRVIHGR